MNTSFFSDMKIYLLSGLTFLITALDIEGVLKILLLTITIAYTGHKMWLNHKNKKADK